MKRGEFIYLVFGSLLYYVTAKIGMSVFSLEPYNLSLLWLPFGIGVILVEKYGLKSIFFIFVASFLSHLNILSNANFAIDIIHRIVPALADSLTPVLSVYLIKKFIKRDFKHISVLLPFAILGGVIPTLLSGIVISLNLAAAKVIDFNEVFEFCIFLIYSDTLGLMLLYLLYKNYDTIAPTKKEKVDICIYVVLSITIILLSITHQYLIFLLYPFLLIATFQMRIKYLMVLLLFVVVFAITVIHTYETYFFTNISSMDSILMVSSFLITLVFIIIGVSLHNNELKKTQSNLNELNHNLENIVYERTKKLNEELNNKNVLLRELHHRVKNNLQIISSLISLQLKRVKDSASYSVLEQTNFRILSISMIHEKLYQSNNFEEVAMQEYIQNLINELSVSFSEAKDIEFNVECSAMEIDLDKAVPIGLIINELVTNAIKYAFAKDAKDKQIHIKIYEASDTISLEIKDNGIGVNLDEMQKGFGFKLLKTLTKFQLKANVEYFNDGGFNYKITLKK